MGVVKRSVNAWHWSGDQNTASADDRYVKKEDFVFGSYKS